MGQVDNQKQGGFIQHYGPSHLRKMIIPIPSLEEQERIVEEARAKLAEDKEKKNG